MVTAIPSSVGSFISSKLAFHCLDCIADVLERAGEHLAEVYTSASEDAYRLDGNSTT
jgi:shikimate kinase